MSLNRNEQYLFDYIEANKEEGQYWRAKVQSVSIKNIDAHDTATQLEGDLWAYYLERAQGAPKFAAGMPSRDLRRTSMRNLAEYLLRLWVQVKPRKNAT